MEKNLKKHPIGGMDETYRREFITASDKVKLLEREVYELQKQLQIAYKRIGELTTNKG
jgi:hypothetical protein